MCLNNLIKKTSEKIVNYVDSFESTEKFCRLSRKS